MTDMTVANTIAQQLGGTRRLQVMAGAKDFVGTEDSLRMKLPSRGPAKTANGCTHMTITLNHMDTYDVVFSKWNARKLTMVPISEFVGIYNDMLIELFEEQTGLLLRF